MSCVKEKVPGHVVGECRSGGRSKTAIRLINWHGGSGEDRARTRPMANGECACVHAVESSPQRLRGDKLPVNTHLTAITNA